MPEFNVDRVGKGELHYVKRFGEPTWQWFVDAVGDPAGGAHMALAQDIARRHKPRGMSSGCAV